MIDANHYLQTTITRMDQLKNRKKLQERREAEAKRKIDIRRYIVIGELICKYFPETKKYHPHRSKKDNAKEFAHFENIIKAMASESDLLDDLLEHFFKKIVTSVSDNSNEENKKDI